MARHDFVAQPIVRERLISKKRDRPHTTGCSLFDDEDHIDPVLRQGFVFRLDPRREASRAPVHVEDPVDVLGDPRRRERTARRNLDLLAQLFFLQRLVALEDDPVDDRVLGHPHHDVVPAPVDRDVGEQAGRKQRLQREIDPVAVKGIARLKQKVGLDGTCLYAHVAFHDDGADVAAGFCALRRSHPSGARRPAETQSER